MALIPGDIGATSGMAAAIYAQLQANIEPDLGDLGEEELDPIREGWRKLAHAVATGVVAHIQSNLEVRDAGTDGTPVRDVDGQTGSAPPSNHAHGPGTLSVTLDDLTFR